MDQCDTKIDLIKYMQVNDLYFMVQWFCFISLLSTVNYFDKLNNGAGRRVFVPFRALALDTTLCGAVFIQTLFRHCCGSVSPNYRKNSKNSDTRKDCCNYPKIGTVSFLLQSNGLKRCRQNGRHCRPWSNFSSGCTLFAQTSLVCLKTYDSLQHLLWFGQGFQHGIYQNSSQR